jgi:uncharacterized protein YdhG (YjbR/CyaY superfamily)
MARLPASVTAYYMAVDGEKRETLLEMRHRILEILPKAQEGMKYAMPTFFFEGEAVCGLTANKAHIGFYPYSGSVISQFPELVSKYTTTKGALHVPIGKPLPKTLLRKLIRARLEISKVKKT